MKRFLIATLLFSTFTVSSNAQSITIEPIYNQLQMGPHAVGFKTYFEFDKTRKPVPYSDWNGKLTYNHSDNPGRQFQINVWYPAEKNTGKPIRFGHYVDLLGLQTQFKSTDETQILGRQRFIEQTNALGGNGAFDLTTMELLGGLATAARHQGEPIDGVFPVVLIPNGSTPAFHSITAEFLASHGFVVVEFSPKGRHSSGMEVSTIGLEIAVDDLEFVLHTIQEWSFVDCDNINLLANAIQSSVCALAASRNNKFVSFVSLEGGFPSAFEQRLLRGSPTYSASQLQLPILVIYAPHPSIDPSFTFHLKYSERYYAHFPQLSEFHTLNFGAFETVIPDVIGEPPGDVAKGFVLANRMILRFLQIKNQKIDGQLFDPDELSLEPPLIDTTFVKASLPATPDITWVKNAFLSKGIGVLDSVFRSHQEAGDTIPFSMSFYTAFRDWLAWKKDPQYKNRKRLYKLALVTYPESILVNYLLGRYSEETDDRELAENQYRKVLTMLENGIMDDLTEEESQQVRDKCESYLENSSDN